MFTRLRAHWRTFAAVLAALVVVAGLLSFDTTHPQAANAAATLCPPGQKCADAYPDPSGYGTLGDLTTATVIMVGDSISNGCRTEIRAALTAGGVDSAINYWSGRPTTQGVSWALSLTRKPPVFVMELGSNDWSDPSVMTGQIARFKAGVPPGTVIVWVDTYNGSQLLATGWTNQQIWASGLTVVPWYQMFAKAPWRDAYYLRDHLHPKTAADQANNTGQGIGCAFFADVVKGPVVAAVQVQKKLAAKSAVKPK